MLPSPFSRRTFLRGSAAWAGGLAVAHTWNNVHAEGDASKPLMAYVGTYSNPEPFTPGGKLVFPANNGRGIHLFQVDRASGILTPAGIVINAPTIAMTAQGAMALAAGGPLGAHGLPTLVG